MLNVKAGRNFCFTDHNVLGDIEDPLRSKLDGLKYIYQLEKAESTGKLHYQGYIRSDKVIHLSGLKKILATAHWENRLGTHIEAYNYCCKLDTRVNGPWFNMDDNPEKPGLCSGRRNDLSIAADLIKTKTSYTDCIKEPKLYSICAKYPNWVKDQLRLANWPVPMVGFVPRKWQQEIVDIISSPADNRTIHWYWDAIGNIGKTELSKYLQLNYGALRLSNSKNSDVAQAYDNEPIVIFDFSRSQEDQINYGVLEHLKNGSIFCPKYNSHTKVFNSPHVIAFANFPCPDGKYSADRLRMIDLSNSTLKLYDDTSPVKKRLKRFKDIVTYDTGFKMYRDGPISAIQTHIYDYDIATASERAEQVIESLML